MGKDSYEMKTEGGGGGGGGGGGDDISIEGDENKERGNWSGKADFLLSAIGYAVGLGNVWRFPYVAYSNGGGSFLFPYVIMLIFAGLPLFFMEMSLGQFSSLGPITMWRISPFFRGLGVAMVIISGLVCIYYNMVIAYTLYYFFASLAKELPWQRCKPDWPDCIDRDLSENATIIRNQTVNWCNWVEMMNKPVDMTDTMEMNNMTTEMMATEWTENPNYVGLDDPDYISNCSIQYKSPSQCYWEYEVLHMSEGIGYGAGEFHWQLILCLILAWIVIFVALIKGIKSSGKVVYVTATFPYIVLIILLIRNVTLEGAKVGIDFYITPQWDQLKSITPWYRAAVQIFYSLGVGFGGLEVMASYNKFKNNVHRDSILVAFINCGTSVFAGFVIFAVIGHMSVKTGVPIEKAAASGPGLAFIAYPEGIALMPVPQLWSILFFLMLFTLGLDSQFTMMETVITSVVDEFPWLRKGKRKIFFTLGLCIFLFILGLPQCASNGVYVMELFNWYSAGFSLFIVAICEIIAISYIYGFYNLRKDIQMMIGEGGLFRYLYWPYWFTNWVIITPCLLVFIFVMACIKHTPITYAGRPNAYPAYADGMGWFMVVFAIMWIPIMGIWEYIKRHDCFGTLKSVFSAEEEWGPAVDRFRTGKYAGTSADPANNPPSYNYENNMDNPGFKDKEAGEMKF